MNLGVQTVGQYMSVNIISETYSLGDTWETVYPPVNLAVSTSVKWRITYFLIRLLYILAKAS